uniref:Uncharacterized protein n=1 Tax=Micrurus corallinus TaxID=54390 RepID=A0A2D4FDI1_MICCO
MRLSQGRLSRRNLCRPPRYHIRSLLTQSCQPSWNESLRRFSAKLQKKRRREFQNSKLPECNRKARAHVKSGLCSLSRKRVARDGLYLASKTAGCFDVILFILRHPVDIPFFFFKERSKSVKKHFGNLLIFLISPVCSQHLYTCLPYDNSTWDNFQKNNSHEAFWLCAFKAKRKQFCTRCEVKKNIPFGLLERNFSTFR